MQIHEPRDETSYSSHDPLSCPGGMQTHLEKLFQECGADPRALARAVRDHMVHIHWRTRYGLEIEQAVAMEEASLRTVSEMLARLRLRSGIHANPLPYERRLIGTCRDFTLFHCALLREAGIPTRPRCGFAEYFLPGHGEDHWVTEWHDAEENRWVIADAQLDRLMIDTLKISFDPDDLPPGRFVSGGEAWTACRSGDDPERYGIFDMRGWDFIKGNLIRDMASLAGFPMKPWDLWGLMLQPFEIMSETDLAFLDGLAHRIPMGVSLSRQEARTLLADPRLALSCVIKTLSPQGAFVDSDVSALLVE